MKRFDVSRDSAETRRVGTAHRNRLAQVSSRRSCFAGFRWAVPTLLIPALLWASEEAHGAHAEARGIPWLTLLFSAINFTLFVLLLRRVALPAIRRWAHERRDRVVKELEEAARARAEAEKLKAEWEARTKNLDAEITALRQQAVADAERERERILATARATAAAIEADAKRAVDQEVRRAREILRDEAVREAVAIAERIVRERATTDDQRRFVDEFLRQVRP